MIKKKEKPHLNIIVLGNADSGRSTTAGHLINKLSSPKAKWEAGKEAAKEEIKGKEISEHAWMLDRMKNERERKEASDFSWLKFTTGNFQFTIMDTSGHRDFVRNYITGTSNAEVALLVISAAKYEFESGLINGYQAFLAYAFGIKQLIVVVNKMDSLGIYWSEERYTNIVKEVSTYIAKVGYDSNKIPFIPISGLLGDNILEKSPNMIWYKGLTLVEALGSLSIPESLADRPLRFALSDVYKISGIGIVPAGKVLSGILKIGMTVTFAPFCLTTIVKSFEIIHHPTEKMFPGDFTGFAIKGLQFKDLKKGYVCGDAENNPPKTAVSFEAAIMITRNAEKIFPGYTPEVDCHRARFACKFVQFKSTIDRRNGNVIEENPKFLKAGDFAIVHMEPQTPVCVEAYRDYPLLGKIAARETKHVVAMGIIINVEKKQK